MTDTQKPEPLPLSECSTKSLELVEAERHAAAFGMVLMPSDDLTAYCRLRDTASAFVAYYSRGGGCSNCGGLPHTDTCFVGRFIVAAGWQPATGELQQRRAAPRIEPASFQVVSGFAEAAATERVRITDTPDTRWWGIYVGSSLVGSVGLMSITPSLVKVCGVYVEPAHRGTGLGTKATEFVLSVAAGDGLDVEAYALNPAWYLRRGFTATGKNHNGIERVERRAAQEPTDADVNEAVDALAEKALRSVRGTSGHAWGREAEVRAMAERLKRMLNTPADQPAPAQGPAALVRLRSLVQEVWDSHRNSDDAHYNQCEEAECAWCQETREALDALKEPTDGR